MKTCKACGKELPEGTKRNYCSDICMKKAQYIKAKERGYVMPKNKTHGPFTCRYCGKEYCTNRTKDGEKYCSRECSFKDWGNRFKGRFNKRINGYPQGAHTKIYIHTCPDCGIVFVSRNKNRSDYCFECQQIRHAMTQARKERGKEYGILVKCKECGKEYKIVYGSKLRDYCSKKCSTKYNRRISKATRRARSCGAECERFDPLSVLRRDKWICMICGKPTPRKLRGTTESNAPELDHVVPLSKGGAHTYSNTQCACRACNSQKSDQILGQLNISIMTGGYAPSFSTTAPS